MPHKQPGNHTPEFKAAVALAAQQDKQCLAELSLRFGVTEVEIIEWQQQLLENAAAAFSAERGTERTLALMDSEEVARTIAENSTHGFAMMNEHGYCVYANRAWLQMTGYTVEEIGSTVLHDLVHHHYPDGKPYPMAECPIDRALPENFEVRAHEDLFFRKDGSTFSVMCAASPIFSRGRPVATVIEIRDITEKKRLDEELARVSKRQAFQLQLADALRSLTDPEDITQAASRLLGEFLQAGRVGYADVDKSDRVVSVKRDWTKGEMSSLAGESRLLDSFGPAIINELRSGRTLCVDDIAANDFAGPYADAYASTGVRSLIVVPLLEGQRLTALLHVHEATVRHWTHDEKMLVEELAKHTWEAVKRARAEEALRDESRILELLNKTGETIASTLDLQTLLQSITDAATELSGAKFGSFFYTSKDEKGGSFLLYTLSGAPREAFEKFGHPRATPVFGPTFAGQGIVCSDDITQDARYGKLAPHHGMPTGHLPVKSYLAVSVLSRSGEVLGGLFFGHPEPGVFTKRAERIILGVAAQAGVAIDNARLYEAAQRATAERELLLASERSARTEAERLNKMKDEFLAMLAHELRNPLAPIISAAEILQFGNQDKERIQRTSGIILRQVNHMTGLIDDLLDVSRVTRGLITLNKEPCDLKIIVSEAVEQARSLIDTKQQHLSVEVADESPFVQGDKTRLTQIVANVLNNAAKYTPSNGHIALQLKCHSDQIEVSVRDDGIGISPELLPHVFDLFTQAERSADRSQGGLGLGLTLVKSLAALHGGSVSVHSDGLGKGSCFTLCFPKLVDISSQQEAPDSQLELNKQRSSKHVLIVDDNVDAAQTLSMMLETLGHKVSVVHDARSALKTAKQNVPDVLFLDIGLPEMDGYELARLLRAMPELAGSTFIAATGYGRTEDKERSVEAGFAHHLVKPVKLDRLLDVIS